MKIACFVAVPLLICTIAAPKAQASIFPDTSDHALAAQADQDEADQPQAKPQKPTRDQLRAMQKLRAQQARERDWLVRSYQSQLRLDSAGQTSNDFSSQVQTDPNLANLAGMSMPTDDPNTLVRASETQAGKAPVQLRNDSAEDEEPDTTKPSYGRTIFQPLITPLSASESTVRHSFYSFDLPTSSAPASFYGSKGNDTDPIIPKRKSTYNTDPNRDSVSIDTPGMTAAEKDPLLDHDPSDLMIDELPQDKAASKLAQPLGNGLLPPQPPLATDLQRLNIQQQASLGLPQKPVTAQPVSAAKTQNPLLLTSPNDPVPDRTPQPITVRTPIGDPYDIFYR
ncbi:MAG: hypothetical protein LV479_04000 [Methylacidiphilales bacterium]|nr:hypothetical protein [Candidatus Methylacidiphilales bacterium]